MGSYLRGFLPFFLSIGISLVPLPSGGKLRTPATNLLSHGTLNAPGKSILSAPKVLTLNAEFWEGFLTRFDTLLSEGTLLLWCTGLSGLAIFQQKNCSGDRYAVLIE